MPCSEHSLAATFDGLGDGNDLTTSATAAAAAAAAVTSAASAAAVTSSSSAAAAGLLGSPRAVQQPLCGPRAVD